jgi:amidase
VLTSSAPARTAIDIARAVRSAALDPVVPTRAALDRIAQSDLEINAFTRVFEESALTDAKALSVRSDLADLPLAGVPVAIKDNTGIDHPVAERLRAAGAVIVGFTSIPEYGIWPTTDSPDRITRNPWKPELSSGGSSGGSAAAVASGMVPIAHGNDGMGSIRIPAAVCGIFGIKPGRGVVPVELGLTGWNGMAENGVLASTVADAATALSVMAADPSLATLTNPSRLRIALDVSLPPMSMVHADRHWRAAARNGGSVAVAAGHYVESAQLPYPSMTKTVIRWCASAALDAQGEKLSGLQRRTKTHIRIGRTANALRVKTLSTAALEDKLAPFFERYELVITPALARNAPRAKNWSNYSWLTNVWASRFAPLNGLWNILGWPAASVPMGRHPDGSPMAVQIAGPPGSEATILGLAAQIESRHPWPVVAF